MLKDYLSEFPKSDGALIIMSGGMDSAIAARLTKKKMGIENVHAMSFYYGQKQSIEIEKARDVSMILGFNTHKTIDLVFMKYMLQEVSANIEGGLAMPCIHDVLGHPQPETYVPNRNAIMLMIAASYAEANKLGIIVTGLQAQDSYHYWDTTRNFVDSMNLVLNQNRQFDLKIHAPFLNKNKSEEIQLLIEMDGNEKLLEHTITCYNPTHDVSCGVCPSCSERIANFKKLGLRDEIPYSVDIPW